MLLSSNQIRQNYLSYLDVLELGHINANNN